MVAFKDRKFNRHRRVSADLHAIVIADFRLILLCALQYCLLLMPEARKILGLVVLCAVVGSFLLFTG